MDLLVTIDKLMPLADPEGAVFRRLTLLKGKVEQNVMLGARDRRFLQQLLQTAQDNIECKHLDHGGGCKIPRVGECEHLNEFKKCPYYLGQRLQTRGNPLSEL